MTAPDWFTIPRDAVGVNERFSGLQPDFNVPPFVELFDDALPKVLETIRDVFATWTDQFESFSDAVVDWIIKVFALDLDSERINNDLHAMYYPWLHITTATIADWKASWDGWLDLLEALQEYSDRLWEGLFNLVFAIFNLTPPDWNRVNADLKLIRYPWLHLTTATFADWRACWDAWVDLQDVMADVWNEIWEGLFNLVFAMLNIPPPDWTRVNADLRLIRYPFLHLTTATPQDWVAAWNAWIDLQDAMADVWNALWEGLFNLVFALLNIPPPDWTRVNNDLRLIRYPFLHLTTAAAQDWVDAWHAWLDLNEALAIVWDSLWEGLYNLLFDLLNLPHPDWSIVNADLHVIRWPFLHLADATAMEWVAAWNAAVDLYHQLSLITTGFWNGVINIIFNLLHLPAPNWAALKTNSAAAWYPFWNLSTATGTDWSSAWNGFVNILGGGSPATNPNWLIDQLISWIKNNLNIPGLDNLIDLITGLRTEPIDISRLYQSEYGLIQDGGFSLRPPGVTDTGEWFWDPSDGLKARGCAGIHVDGRVHELIGAPIVVAAGQKFTFDANFKWSNVTGSATIELVLVEFSGQVQVGQSVLGSMSASGTSASWANKIKGSQHVVSSGVGLVSPMVRITGGGSGTIRVDDVANDALAHLLLEWIGLFDGTLKDLFDLFLEAGDLFSDQATTVEQWSEWATRLFTTLGFPEFIAAPLGEATGFLLGAVVGPISKAVRALADIQTLLDDPTTTKADWQAWFEGFFDALGMGWAVAGAAWLADVWFTFVAPVYHLFRDIALLVAAFFAFDPLGTYLVRLTAAFDKVMADLSEMFLGAGFTTPNPAGAAINLLKVFWPALGNLVDVVAHFLTIGDLLYRHGGESDAAWQGRWATWLTEVFTLVGIPGGVAASSGAWLADIAFNAARPILSVLALFRQMPTTANANAWLNWLTALFNLLLPSANVGPAAAKATSMWFDMLGPLFDWWTTLNTLIGQLGTLGMGGSENQWATWVSNVLVELFDIAEQPAATIANWLTRLWFRIVDPLVKIMTYLGQVLTGTGGGLSFATDPITTLRSVGEQIMNWWQGLLGPPTLSTAASSAQTTATTTQTNLGVLNTNTVNLAKTLAPNIGSNNIPDFFGPIATRLSAIDATGVISALNLVNLSSLPSNTFTQAQISGLTTALNAFSANIATLSNSISQTAADAMANLKNYIRNLAIGVLRTSHQIMPAIDTTIVNMLNGILDVLGITRISTGDI